MFDSVTEQKKKKEIIITQAILLMWLFKPIIRFVLESWRNFYETQYSKHKILDLHGRCKGFVLFWD